MRVNPPTTRASRPKSWRDLLQQVPIKDSLGQITGWKPTPNLFNLALILTHHPVWKGLLMFNEFAEAITKMRPIPGVAMMENKGLKGNLTDADIEAVRVWFIAQEKVVAKSSDIKAAIVHASRQNSRHPVRDYLHARKWDRKDRLETVLIDYFGAADTPYIRGIGKLWFISAIARVMQPGCQVDYALVFESTEQGWKKSQSLRNLVPEKAWFSDTGISIGDKDSYQNLHGAWIYCLDEMASVHGADVQKMKNFMTGTIDRYRKSYGHFVESIPRQNVFCCTVNPEEGGIFADRTGNRRFWPVRMTKKADVVGLVKVRDQLWAEAKARFDAKEKWWPDDKLTALCAAEQRVRVQIDPWVELIRTWMARKCPMRDEQGHFLDQRVPMGRGVSTAEVLMHALGKQAGHMTRGDSMRVASCLKELDFASNPVLRMEGGTRDRYYLPNAPRPTNLEPVAAGAAKPDTTKQVAQVVQLKRVRPLDSRPSKK